MVIILRCDRDPRIRDAGRDRGRLWILERSDFGPEFRGSGTAGGAFRSGGTPGANKGAQEKNSRDAPDHFDPWKLFQHVEVNANLKKKSHGSGTLAGAGSAARSGGTSARRLSRSTWASSHWQDPWEPGPAEVRQMCQCEDQRPGKLRLAGNVPVRGVPREHDARGREVGRQVARRVTQQSAEDATLQQSGVDVTRTFTCKDCKCTLRTHASRKNFKYM
jgi:hypothetical protein